MNASPIVILTEILSHTPLWVWGVFVLLIWRGLSSAQDREVTAQKLVILPAVIFYLALNGLAATAHSPFGDIAVGIGVLLGIGAGFARFNRTSAYQVAPGVIRMRGEWSTMIVILAIFFLHYAAGVLQETDPALTQSHAFVIMMGGASAFLSSMTITVAALLIRLAYLPYDEAEDWH